MAEEEEVEKSREKYKEFVGKEMKGFKVKIAQEKIKKYCEAVGHMNPRYVDENREGGTIVPPEAAAMYGMGVWTGLMSAGGLIKDFGRLLHTGQSYEYFEPVRPGDELTVESKLVDVHEKGNMLWITAEGTMYNQDGKKTTVSRITAGIRPGGFKKL
jgi:acyl dehydratase